MVLALIIIYTIVFSYLTCLKHYVFASYAYDLGIFSQALYSTIFHGKLFYYTVESYVNPTGTYFAIHFSPILFTLIPFYYILPKPETLLIIGSFILALGALPLYILTRRLTGSNRIAFLVGLIYLIHHALQGANWFDFHLQNFYPVLIFSMYYFFIERRWKLYCLFVILTLMVMESSAFMIMVFAVNLLLANMLTAKSFKESVERVKSKECLILFFTIVIALAWLLFVNIVKNTLFPLDPSFKPLLGATNNWNILYKVEYEDFDPLLRMPLYILFNPEHALEALTYDYHAKFLYIVVLYGPLLFLPLESPLVLSSVILLIPFLLSNYKAYYSIGTQYSLHILPFIFLAFIDVIQKDSKSILIILLKKVYIPIIVAALLFTISISPISPLSYAFLRGPALLWYPDTPLRIDENVKNNHMILELIPSNASVLASNSVFPHVSNRLHAYAIPAGGLWRYNPSLTMEYLLKLVNKSDYIVIRISDCHVQECRYILNLISNSKLFGLYATTKDMLLFKRGYHGDIISFYPKIILDAKDMVLGKHVERINYPEPAIFYPKFAGADVVVYGPYIPIPPGTYKVTYVIMVSEISEGYVAKLDVAYNYGKKILAQYHVYGFTITPRKWANITLIFYTDSLLMDTEFRVFATGISDLYVNKIIIEPLKSGVQQLLTTFNHEDLLFTKNATIDKGLLMHSRDFIDEVFWYGPYITLTPGHYKVEFYIKAVPEPKEEDKIITLDVVSGFRKGQGITLIKVDVYGGTLIRLSSNWYIVRLYLNITATLSDCEFRGLSPSRNHDIFLAYILLEKLR